MKREQEIISVQRQIDGFRDSYKRLNESQKVQQCSLDNCLMRLEHCENTKDSIQMLTSSELDIRERLEEVQFNVQNCLTKRRTFSVSEDDADDTSSIGSKSASGVNPLLTGHVAKLSRDIASVTERMASLELCMQGSALDRQDSSTSDNNVVSDIRRMQLSIATISRSVSRVAKDVFEMRSSDLTSRSSTATSLSSILSHRSLSGHRPSSPNSHSSSSRIDRLPEKPPPVQESPSAPSLTMRSPGMRSPNTRPLGTGLRTYRASGNEDTASDTSTSVQSRSPLSTHRDTLSTSSRSLSKFGTARGALSAVPEDSRSAAFRATTTSQRSLTEPVRADRFSLRPRLSVRHQRHAAHLYGNNPDPSPETSARQPQ